MSNAIDELFDKYTEALTETTETLHEGADPSLGEPGDEISIVSFDRRVMKDLHEFKQALYEAVKSAIPEQKQHIESDRNIVYREGWNDCREAVLVNVEGLFYGDSK